MRSNIASTCGSARRPEELMPRGLLQARQEIDELVELLRIVLLQGRERRHRRGGGHRGAGGGPLGGAGCGRRAGSGGGGVGGGGPGACFAFPPFFGPAGAAGRGDRVFAPLV